MSYRQTFEGSDRPSCLSRLDGRTKLSILFLYAIMMVLVDNGRTLFILFTVTLILHFLENPGGLYPFGTLGFHIQPGPFLCPEPQDTASHAHISGIPCAGSPDKGSLYL